MIGCDYIRAAINNQTPARWCCTQCKRARIHCGSASVAVATRDCQHAGAVLRKAAGARNRPADCDIASGGIDGAVSAKANGRIDRLEAGGVVCDIAIH